MEELMCEWITNRSTPDHTNFVVVAIGDEVWVAYWDGQSDLWRFNDSPPARPDIINAWMELPVWAEE